MPKKKEQPEIPLTRPQADLVARLAGEAAAKGRSRYYAAGRPRELAEQDFVSEALWSVIGFVLTNTGPDGKCPKGRSEAKLTKHAVGRVWDRGTDLVRKNERYKSMRKKYAARLTRAGRIPQTESRRDHQ